jgi:hypothetical protein
MHLVNLDWVENFWIGPQIQMDLERLESEEAVMEPLQAAI